LSFDVKAKENQPIVNFMKSSRALVLDSAAASRSAIRSLLSSLGVPSLQIKAVETVDQGLQFAEEMRPNIIITEMSIGGRSCFGLLDIYRRNFQSSLKGIFIFLSSTDSPIVNYEAVEADIDALIVKPFTISIMEGKLIEVSRPKGLRPPYLVAIENAKIEINDGNFDLGLQILQGAVSLDSKPFAAYAAIGQVHFNQGNFVEAEKAFSEGLKLNPSSYPCLIGLFDILLKKNSIKGAQQVLSKIIKSNAVPLAKVPDLLRISVENREFEEVMVLVEMVMAHDKVTDDLILCVSDAMIVCAKQLLLQDETIKRITDRARREKEEIKKAFDKTKGLEILQKVHAFGRNIPKIQVDIVSCLFEVGLEKDAVNFTSRLSPEVRESSELKIVELEYFLRTGQIDIFARLGEKLISSGMVNYRLYEIMIQNSKHLKMSTAAVLELISKAGKLFPDKKEALTNLIQSPGDAG